MEHRAVAIIPSRDLDKSEAFYRRLQFKVVSDPSGLLVRIGRILE